MTHKPSEIPDDFFLVRVPGKSGEEPLETLSFSRAPNILLTHCSNRITALGSAPLKEGPSPIGTVEFKVMVVLARHRDSSVAFLVKTIGIDKGAISRSLAKLEKQGLVQSETPYNDDRRKEWSLTRKGLDLHNSHIEGSIDFQKRLLAGFSVQDVEQLNLYLNRILKNVDILSGRNGD